MTVKICGSSVITTLSSGHEVHACSRDDQGGTAAELGYGADVDAMTRDHDPLHTLLARWLGAGDSYALRAAAGTLREDEQHLAQLEEAAVMAVQRFAIRAGLGDNLRALIDGIAERTRER